MLFLSFSLAITVVVLNSETNRAISSSTLNYDGVNHTAPTNLSKPPGTILNITAIKTGYTVENKVVTVYDASGVATQKIVFLMSATLVSFQSGFEFLLRSNKCCLGLPTFQPKPQGLK